MQNDNVLKPCPFCGGDVKHIQGLPPLDDSHFIDCPGCGISSKIASTKEAVIEAWNRRAHPGQPEPRAEVTDEWLETFTDEFFPRRDVDYMTFVRPTMLRFARALRAAFAGEGQ